MGLKPSCYVSEAEHKPNCEGEIGGESPYCFEHNAQGMLSALLGPDRTAGGNMEWTAPTFEEICLNCEINSYASAKL